MTDRRSSQSQASRRGIPGQLGVGLAAALLLVACNATTPPPSITDVPLPVASAQSSDVVSQAPPAGQSDTAWGRIWEELPEAFPIYPGATPADDAATEPVSGTFALEGTDGRVVASWMQTELERAAYRTEALNGPFEDGSYILELVGPADCRIEVAVGPLGGLTRVSVRYGAACPSP